MEQYKIISLREMPEIIDHAAEWFHGKWGVPKEAYFESMQDYINKNIEYGWYLCLSGKK